MIGVYKITSPSGKVYIGQSVNLKNRFRQYNQMKSKNQPRLHASFQKHGIKNHFFEILQECEVSELNLIERHFQDKFNAVGENGLNCALTATNDKSGGHSAETKIKIATASNGNTNFKGRNHSPESKQMASEKHTGKILSESTKELIRKANLGKKHSEESKTKQSENSTKVKIVLNLETGIFHRSVKEVSQTYMNLRQNTLITKLSGHRFNNTQFTYI